MESQTKTETITDGAWFRLERKNGLMSPVRIDIEEGMVLDRKELAAEDVGDITTDFMVSKLLENFRR